MVKEKIGTGSGVYEIVNTKNGKRYIGQSCTLRKRWRIHKILLRKNEHPNGPLQIDWNSQTENDFIFKVIEYCNVDLLDAIEQRYLDNTENKYNIWKSVVMGEDARKPVKQICPLTFKVVKVWDSMSDITKIYNKTSSKQIISLKRDIENKYKRWGYYWCYGHQTFDPSNLPRLGKAGCIRIAQFSLDNKLVKIWESAVEIYKYLNPPISMATMRTKIY